MPSRCCLFAASNVCEQRPEGQLGQDHTKTHRNLSSQSGCQIKSKAQPAHSTLFLLQSGSVYTCGDNAMGQLGVGDVRRRLVPTLVSASHEMRVRDIAAGGLQTALIDGTVCCLLLLWWLFVRLFVVCSADVMSLCVQYMAV